MREGYHHKPKKRDLLGNTKLTNRERQIASLIYCEAYSSKQIAKILGIAKGTVETHVLNIFRKKNLSSRLELVKYYRELERKKESEKK